MEINKPKSSFEHCSIITSFFRLCPVKLAEIECGISGGRMVKFTKAMSEQISHLLIS